MIPLLGTILSILSTVTGQLGPNYDPLFYDVMVYIFGTIMFTIFLLGLIAFWLRVHGWSYKDNRERWVDELDRHFEKEGIGLIPDNGKYWYNHFLFFFSLFFNRTINQRLISVHLEVRR